MLTSNEISIIYEFFFFASMVFVACFFMQDILNERAEWAFDAIVPTPAQEQLPTENTMLAQTMPVNIPGYVEIVEGKCATIVPPAPTEIPLETLISLSTQSVTLANAVPVDHFINPEWDITLAQIDALSSENFVSGVYDIVNPLEPQPLPQDLLDLIGLPEDTT